MKRLDLLQSEFHTVLVRYRRSPSAANARDALRCLEAIVMHPDFSADLAGRCVCKRMLGYWRLMAERDA